MKSREETHEVQKREVPKLAPAEEQYHQYMLGANRQESFFSEKDPAVLVNQKLNMTQLIHPCGKGSPQH